MSVQSFKDLEVWQKSMSLVTEIYALTARFPKEELYGLTSQIRRAAVSIPSNIAEGRSKRSTRDFMRFIHIAYGSAAELETQLLIAQNLRYVGSETIQPIIAQLHTINRMLNGLLNGLDRKLSSSQMPNANPQMPITEDA